MASCGDTPDICCSLDEDGQCYDYDIFLDAIVPVEPDGAWAVDVIEEGQVVIVAPEEKVAGAQPTTTNAS